MKAGSFWRLSLMFLTAFAALPAHAGDKEGNGGGAWVCRETNGQLRWVKFIDLFEAVHEFNLTLGTYSGAPSEITDQVVTRLSRVNAPLAAAISDQLNRIGYLKPNPPQVQYSRETLEVIDDSLWRLKPEISECRNGLLVIDPKNGEQMVPYEQMINFKQDGKILVQQDLFDRLSPTEQAAALLHEAVYAYRRARVSDTNSVVSRQIVGLAFSTLSLDELQKRLSLLGENSDKLMKPEPSYPIFDALRAAFDQADRATFDNFLPHQDPRWRQLHCSQAFSDIPGGSGPWAIPYRASTTIPAVPASGPLFPGTPATKLDLVLFAVDGKFPSQSDIDSERSYYQVRTSPDLSVTEPVEELGGEVSETVTMTYRRNGDKIFFRQSYQLLGDSDSLQLSYGYCWVQP